MTKQIELTQGYVAIVDDEDYDYLMQWKWYAQKHGRTHYARRNVGKGKNRKTLTIHQALMQPGAGQSTDHIDGDGLNNQRSNLRVVSHGQNCFNKRLYKNNTSGYKGVQIKHNKWSAAIRKNGKARFVGYFSTAEEAARAYDKAAIEYFGEFARLNFPQ